MLFKRRNNILLDIIFPLIGLLICTSLLIFFIKNKRSHKDFYGVVITASFFSVLCLFLVVWSIEDFIAIQTNNFQIVTGKCTVREFESNGRTAIHDLLVDINGELDFTGDFDKFNDVRQGTYDCTVKYIEKSRTLYDIHPLSTNE